MFPESKNMSILSATLYILIGSVMALFPGMSAQLLSISVGLVFVIIGVILLTTYFVLDIDKILYRNDFVFGILSILAGLVIIIQKDLILTLIPIVLGLVIMSSGLMKLQKAVVAHRIKSNQEMTYFILSVVALILGLVVIFILAGHQSQQVLFIVIGIGLIYAGISDLFALFVLENSYKKAVETLKNPQTPREEVKESEEENV
ncbi:MULTISPECIES: DUF308 domain-containing protein [Terrabacteria group]|uniref:DUF308 domain-containing protein n=1 Tax=Bacillati TaxID=1783272 RepID=UPI00193A7F50|nr:MULTISPECIES: DUF308 domain-containing protein [Terrabacteria group]MBW9212598.1 DUF308 domain-containing protein [Trueperella sp. zg.1013]QRG86907.1 DUF308 domain-containing protein [Bulleidia sp. zg-1006]